MTDQTLTGQLDPYAAIDLGTNTCLLLVARWDGSRLIPLADELRVVRLGAGIDRTGMISDDAIARTEIAFREYRTVIESHQCRRVQCVATCAFREASNRDHLRRRIRRATGYDLIEISGRQEAELVLRAVQHDFPAAGGPRLIIDVGGGSTEITLVEGDSLAAVASLPLGSVRLTERWLTSDPPSPAELAAALREINSMLDKIWPSPPVETIIGVGGTATTFIAMDLQLAQYDHSRVHGAALPGSTLQRVLEHCAALPLKERLKLPGLHPGRADVIIAGGLILQALMERSGQDRMIVSDRGLRWGVMLEMLAR